MSEQDRGSAMARFQEAAVAGGQAVQKVETRFVTAVSVQKPRDLRQVEQKVIDLCEQFPDGLYYSWTTKNRDGTQGRVEGATIKLAMALAREFGNCATEARLLSQDNTHWLFEGVYLDLETGFTCVRLFRQRRPTGGKGGMTADRNEDTQFQVGQSKAIRNAVINSMPAGLVIKAMEASRAAQAKALTSGKGGLAGGISRAIEVFRREGITVDQMEARIGRGSADWTREDLADLKAILTAIEEGATTAKAEFSMGEPEPEPEQSSIDEDLAAFNGPSKSEEPNKGKGEEPNKGKGKGKGKELSLEDQLKGE